MRRAGRFNRQRGGVALMFAILIVALTASVAANISYDMALDVRRTYSLLYQEQARLVALGAEEWVSIVLGQDLELTQEDHLGEPWAQPLPPLPVEGPFAQGEVVGRLIDLQSRFNLNNLLNPDGTANQPQLERFQRLLTQTGNDPQLAEAVIDWMDADTEMRFPGGAEDDTYLGRIPGVLAANRPFRSIGELALIEGFEAEGLAQLRPHVTALPEVTLVNANTATPQLLLALDPNMSPGDVELIVEEREESGLPDINTTFAALVDPNTLVDLSLETNYFELRSVVRIGTVRFTMYSLLYRSAQGEVAVLMRSFGTEL